MTSELVTVHFKDQIDGKEVHRTARYTALTGPEAAEAIGCIDVKDVDRKFTLLVRNQPNPGKAA